MVTSHVTILAKKKFQTTLNYDILHKYSAPKIEDGTKRRVKNLKQLFSRKLVLKVSACHYLV